jgi:hypothetical protein
MNGVPLETVDVDVETPRGVGTACTLREPFHDASYRYRACSGRSPRLFDVPRAGLRGWFYRGRSSDPLLRSMLATFVAQCAVNCPRLGAEYRCARSTSIQAGGR